jgi:hypothetical protein
VAAQTYKKGLFLTKSWSKLLTNQKPKLNRSYLQETKANLVDYSIIKIPLKSCDSQKKLQNSVFKDFQAYFQAYLQKLFSQSVRNE